MRSTPNRTSRICFVAVVTLAMIVLPSCKENTPSSLDDPEPACYGAEGAKAPDEEPLPIELRLRDPDDPKNDGTVNSVEFIGANVNGIGLYLTTEFEATEESDGWTIKVVPPTADPGGVASIRTLSSKGIFPSNLVELEYVANPTITHVAINGETFEVGPETVLEGCIGDEIVVSGTGFSSDLIATVWGVESLEYISESTVSGTLSDPEDVSYDLIVTNAPESCPASASVPIDLGQGCDDPEANVVYIGLMIHVENWSGNFTSELVDYANLLASYDAKGTFEAGRELGGGIFLGISALPQLVQDGHAIGLHADLCGPPGDCTDSDFAADLSDMQADFVSALGSSATAAGISGFVATDAVRHVSGICSDADWVNAALSSDFEFSTGHVDYCRMSLDTSSPDALATPCTSPCECHDPWPFDTASGATWDEIDRVHPWYVDNGQFWTDRSGTDGLVLLPRFNSLKHLAEEQGGISVDVCPPAGGSTIGADDIDAYFSFLQTILDHNSAEEPGHRDFFYVGYSFGGPLPAPTQALLEDWLSRLQDPAYDGRIQWATLPEMYDEFR